MDDREAPSLKLFFPEAVERRKVIAYLNQSLETDPPEIVAKKVIGVMFLGSAALKKNIK